MELGPDPAGQSEEQGVDDQSEQAQGQDNEQAGQSLEGRAQDGIDQTEYQGQPDNINPIALVENVFWQQDDGNV